MGQGVRQRERRGLRYRLALRGRREQGRGVGKQLVWGVWVYGGDRSLELVE
jgi:hypothetical protein